MTRSASEIAYIERTERERRARFAKARAEGCPAGWEEEWQHSAKLKMMVHDMREREKDNSAALYPEARS